MRGEVATVVYYTLKVVFKARIHLHKIMQLHSRTSTHAAQAFQKLWLTLTLRKGRPPVNGPGYEAEAEGLAGRAFASATATAARDVRIDEEFDRSGKGNEAL